jgi:hypothetical protein
MSAKLITVYNDINWEGIVTYLTDKKGSEVTTDPARWKLSTPGYNDIYQMWINANFNPESIKWINYYPGKHYSNEVVMMVSKLLGITSVRSWISRIDPGFIAPYHWDVDDNEQEYLKNGKLYRYTCFMNDPTVGHILILGEEYFYNQEKGSLYEWDNYKDWHSGINAGMCPQFMFHVLGYKSTDHT